jgi:hypothetical protein
MQISGLTVDQQRERLVNRIKSGKFAIGCLILFALPLFGAGLSLVLISFGAIRTNGENPTAILIGVGSIFIIVSLSIVLAGIRAFSKARRQAELALAHPSEPWMWEESWASGYSPDEKKVGSIALVVFAIVWCSLTFPVAWYVLFKTEKFEIPLLLVAIFPLAGSLLLIAALVAFFRSMRFGKSRLRLDTRPGKLGGRFTATIEASSLPDQGVVIVALICEKLEVRGTGKNRSVIRTVMWQDEQEIPANFIVASPGGSSMNIDFVLPSDMPESMWIDERDRIVWRVEATADVPGFDYEAEFTVPVYGHSDVVITRQPPSPFTLTVPRDVRIETGAEGTSYRFPARPFQNGAIGATITTLIFSAALWAVVHFGAPIIVAIIIGLVTLLCLMSMFNAWLGNAAVRIESNHVSLMESNGLFSSTKSVARSDIAEVTATFRSSNQKVEQIVELVTTDGKRYPAGRSFRRKREAEWFAAEIRKQVGGNAQRETRNAQ